MYISVVGLKAQDGLATVPKNTVGVTGQNITLNCALTDPDSSTLDWINSAGVTVYQDRLGVLPEYENEYYVEPNSPSHNLVILNADQNDAGRYTCLCSTRSSSALAEVIIIGIYILKLDPPPLFFCKNSGPSGRRVMFFFFFCNSGVFFFFFFFTTQEFSFFSI